MTGIAGMLAAAFAPILVGRALDEAVEGASGRAVVASGGAVVGVFVLVAAANAARHHLAMLIWMRARLLVERRLTDRVLDRRGGVDRPPGELLSLGIGDATSVAAAADITSRGSAAIVTLAVAAAWLLSTSVSLGLLVLVTVPSMLAIVLPFLGTYERRARAERAELARASAAASDGIFGLRLAAGIGGTGQLARWFQERSSAMHDSALALVRLQAALFAAVGSQPVLALAPVLWVGGNQVIDGDLSIGTLVAVVGLAQFLIIPIGTIAELTQTVTAGRASSARITAVLDQPYAVPEPVNAPRPAGSAAPGLRVTDLCTEHTRGLTFEARPGETVGLVAAEPAIMSELVEVLSRRRTAEGGAIMIAGEELSSIPLGELHRRLAVVDAERPWLMSGSLFENLALARPGIEEHEAVAALQGAAADDLLARSEPLRVQVGERGARLSGGQRQRVAVAQGLVAPADVLVLVEPTSALDSVTERRLVDRALEPASSRATLVVSSSPAALGACTRVIFLGRDGAAVEGTHTELLATQAGYRSVVTGDEG